MATTRKQRARVAYFGLRTVGTVAAHPSSWVHALVFAWRFRPRREATAEMMWSYAAWRLETAFANSWRYDATQMRAYLRWVASAA